MSFDMNPAPQARGGAAFRDPRHRYPNLQSVPPRIEKLGKVAARRPDGSLICLSDLPDQGLRWTRLRKTAVIECIQHGLLRAEAACTRYGVTPEELAEWQETVACRGRSPVHWSARPVRVTGGVVTAGAMRIDLDNRTLSLDGEPMVLAPSEWRVLGALAQADGAIVSNAMVMGALYTRAEDAAGPKIADVLICRLRKKLGAEGQRIVSVWGRGYYLAR